MPLTPRLAFRRRERDGGPGAIDLLSSSLLGYSADPDGWCTSTQQLLQPLDTESALAAHLGGRTYSAVRRDNGRTVVVAFHHATQVRVTRYDPSGAVAAETREFRVVDDQLWLRGIKRCNGGFTVPRTDAVTDWFTWVQPATTATWTRFDQRSPQGRSHGSRTGWDPDDHWYPRPVFGDYASVIGTDDLLRRLWPDVDPLPFLGP